MEEYIIAVLNELVSHAVRCRALVVRLEKLSAPHAVVTNAIQDAKEGERKLHEFVALHGVSEHDVTKLYQIAKRRDLFEHEIEPHRAVDPLAMCLDEFVYLFAQSVRTLLERAGLDEKHQTYRDCSSDESKGKAGALEAQVLPGVDLIRLKILEMQEIIQKRSSDVGKRKVLQNKPASKRTRMKGKPRR